MQKAPVRTSSSESFGSFILRRATRTDARVRSSGYKQAHEKRMRDARQGCDRSCCARLLRAVRVGAHQHLRPRRLLLLLPRVAGFCSDRARLGRCWPRILLRHPLHILVAVARGHAGEPIFRLVAAAAALRRCALGLRARRRQPRSQNAHDQPRARSSAHRQIGKAHFCPGVEKVSFTLKRPRETSRTKVKSCNHWGLLTTDESMAFYNLPTRSYCTIVQPKNHQRRKPGTLRVVSS